MKAILISLFLPFLLLQIGVDINGEPSKETGFKNEFILSDLTLREVNCVIVREILDGLPFYETVKSGFLDYFRKRPERNLKSFRKIMIGILKRIVYQQENDLNPSQTERFQVALLMENLRKKKEKYAKMTTDVDAKKFHYETERSKALLDELTEQKDRLREFNEKIRQKELKIKQNVTDLNDLQIQLEMEPDYVGQFEDYHKFQEMHDKIIIADENSQEKEKFIDFLKNKLKDEDSVEDFKYLVRLKNQHRKIIDLKNWVNLMEDIPTQMKNELIQGNVVGLPSQSETNSDMQSLTQICKFLEDNIKSETEKIQSKIKTKIKETVNNIKKNENYSTYIKTIKKVNTSKLEITKLKIQRTEIKNKIQKIQNEQGNLEMSSLSDFTLAHDSQLKVETKLQLIRSHFNPELFSSVNLPHQSQSSNVESITHRYAGVLQNEDFLFQVLNYYEEKLALIQQINEFEEQIDVYLGKLFASLQVLPNNFRCFSTSYLSYLFFTLVKINAVVKETHFLQSFLDNTLYMQAKEFIVFNYSLLADEEFMNKQFGMDDFNLQLPHKLNIDRELIKSVYVDNWCLLVNIYKEFTEFGVQTEDGNIRRVGIGRRIVGILKISMSVILGTAKDVGVGEAIGKLITMLIKAVPVIGNIMFLETFLNNVCGYIVEFIIGLVMKYAENKVARAKNIWEKFKEVFQKLRHPSIFDLEYHQYIQRDLDIHGVLSQNERFKLKFESHKIERVYLDLIEKEKTMFEKYFDKITLFDKTNKTLHVPSLKYPEILEDVLNLANRPNYLHDKMEEILKKKIIVIEANMKDGIEPDQYNLDDISGVSSNYSETRPLIRSNRRRRIRGYSESIDVVSVTSESMFSDPHDRKQNKLPENRFQGQFNKSVNSMPNEGTNLPRRKKLITKSTKSHYSTVSASSTSNNERKLEVGI